TRRGLIHAAALMGAAGVTGSEPAEAGLQGRRAATPLSPEETAAVDQALGKKGSMVADQGVYTVPLPRADLKVKIQGDPVPTGFGFGGWVAFKKAPGGSTVFM